MYISVVAKYFYFHIDFGGGGECELAVIEETCTDGQYEKLIASFLIHSFLFALFQRFTDALSSSVFFSHLVLHGGIIDRNKFIIVYFTVIQNKASRRLDQLELFFWFFVVNFACSTVAGTV